MEMEEDISSHLNSGSAAFRMSTLQPLREYINEQLAAAAEEIFRQVEKTFRQLEEELCRQHRLLGISWKPHLQLHNIFLPQHYLSADQEQRNQDRSSKGKGREPEPPCVKEEWEEVVISQESKQLDLKQEAEVSMETPTPEEREQTPVSLNSHQLQTHEEAELKNTDQGSRGDRSHVKNEAISQLTGSHCGSNSENMLEKDVYAKGLTIKTLVEKPQKSVEKFTCVMSGPPQKLQENVSICPVTAFSPPAAPAPLPSAAAQPVQRHPPRSIGLLQPVRLSNGQVVFKSPNQVYLTPNPAAPLLNTCSIRTKRPGEQLFKSQPYIKKPPNAFMLFLKEQRAAVPPELKSNSSAVNKLLGEKWSVLSEEQKAKYFNQADEEKRLHAQQHPDWSSSDNYGKKKRISRKGAPSRIQGLNVLPGSIRPCAPL
ncbi:transcription factor SOX-30 isoform X2 [Oryzias melastigma]|uniref:transcription factor SOX-30 isoform X2 n=1 Tax=Oryzias melastigma TaxID=30732 RepID=UPI000CF7F92B|nr:transcription factor SOX-30 isoform X2 [Oryzias melastigma]